MELCNWNKKDKRQTVDLTRMTSLWVQLQQKPQFENNNKEQTDQHLKDKKVRTNTLHNNYQ